jgi:hypothetical protein
MPLDVGDGSRAAGAGRRVVVCASHLRLVEAVGYDGGGSVDVHN